MLHKYVDINKFIEMYSLMAYLLLAYRAVHGSIDMQEKRKGGVHYV
jgi:hypothetical protein